jgi:hypothetical protein
VLKPSAPDKVNLAFLQAGWRAAGGLADVPDPDDQRAEVECVLANLIHRKWVRGYLSHSPPVLVLSRTNPFPPLTDVLPSGGGGGAGS